MGNRFQIVILRWEKMLGFGTCTCNEELVWRAIDSFVHQDQDLHKIAKICAQDLCELLNNELLKNCLRHLESCFLKLAVKLQKVCGHLKYVSCQCLDLPMNENIWTQVSKIQVCEKANIFSSFVWEEKCPTLKGCSVTAIRPTTIHRASMER